VILEPLMVDVAALGEEPEVSRETFSYDVEVTACLDGFGDHAIFELLESSIDIVKLAIDVVEPSVDLVKPFVDVVKPLGDLVKPLVDGGESAIDVGESAIDVGESAIDVSLQLSDRHCSLALAGHPTIVLREPCPGRFVRK
jgi:hypothetical protein